MAFTRKQRWQSYAFIFVICLPALPFILFLDGQKYMPWWATIITWWVSTGFVWTIFYGRE